MNFNRLWIIGCAILCVAVLAFGWVVGISPKISEASSAAAERVGVEATNDLHEIELANIKKQYANIADLRSQLDELRSQLPQTDDLAEFIGQLHEIEGANGVKVSNLTVGAATPFVAAADAESAAAAHAELVTEDNFIVIPIAVSVGGTYENVMKFVAGLQHGTRLFVMSNLTVSRGEDATSGEQEPASTTPTFAADIAGFIYVLLDPSPSSGTPADDAATKNG